ncbi:MAG TPA: four helix bundle protein [Gemmatimonadaceae bacterium]|nr:four helix bundle protein [Gemmatimonadaceae bacterium]
MQGFKHIVAWQRGYALGIAIARTAVGFSRRGHTNLRTQLTKAAESIATNIVEGCGAPSNKEFARYLGISIKSANETEHHLMVAHGHGLLSDQLWHKYTAEVIEVRKMIYSYRRKVLDSDRDAD